jgi:3'-phosphoadenosine 5'-phosphosulfate sulfotransferase (PAPS reductase)/FAD synthetase
LTDPFRIEGPAILSISGGRTSGYMLWRILQAHGGTLPSDVRAIFTNTGKEMLETLDFLKRCADEWRLDITWLEYRTGKKWAVVDYDTASRKGEPFEALITDRNFLPNPVARICTVELKVLTIERYVTTDLGWEHFTNVVGIRADEPRRLAKIGNSGRAAFDRIAPLGPAGVTALDVSRFWEQQPFDLGLPNRGGKTMHGNCDLCFLKGADQVLSLIREQPNRAIWWMEQENRIHSRGQIKGDAGKFRSDRPSYAEMHRMATQHGELFEYGDEALQDCMCVD